MTNNCTGKRRGANQVHRKRTCNRRAAPIFPGTGEPGKQKRSYSRHVCRAKQKFPAGSAVGNFFFCTAPRASCRRLRQDIFSFVPQDSRKCRLGQAEGRNFNPRTVPDIAPPCYAIRASLSMGPMNVRKRLMPSFRSRTSNNRAVSGGGKCTRGVLRSPRQLPRYTSDRMTAPSNRQTSRKSRSARVDSTLSVMI